MAALAGAALLAGALAPTKCESDPPEVEPPGDGSKSGGANSSRQTASDRSTRSTSNWPAGLAGYLLAERSDERLDRAQPTDLHLLRLLARSGPDMRPMRDFEQLSDDITLEVAQRAWQVMHGHALAFVGHKLEASWPQLELALEAANVSAQCRAAAAKTVQAALKLDSWALQRKYQFRRSKPAELLSVGPSR